jgi:sigma-E factor negative regulatory protein RseA
MNEKISALMDDEISLEDNEYLLSAIKSNDSLKQTWSTYHMIGDVMRGESFSSPFMTQAIMDKIAKEPTVLAPMHKRLRKSPAVWSAVASVAGVFFVGWMVFHHQSESLTSSVEMARNIPTEYLVAHQSMAVSSAYLIQPASFNQGE